MEEVGPLVSSRIAAYLWNKWQGDKPPGYPQGRYAVPGR